MLLFAKTIGQNNVHTGTVMTDNQLQVSIICLKFFNECNWGGCLAMEPIVRELAVNVRVSMPSHAASCYRLLGLCHMDLEQIDQAFELFEEARRISEDMGDRTGLAEACSYLGDCHNSIRQYGMAVGLYEQARAICEEEGDIAGHGRLCGNLGDCHLMMGQYDKAIERQHRALAIAKEVSDSRAEGLACNILGKCYFLLGFFRKAVQFHEQSQTIFKELGDKVGKIKACFGLGDIFSLLREYDKAVSLYEEALTIAEEMDSQKDKAFAYIKIGYSLRDSGDGEGSARALVRGLLSFQRAEQDVGAHDERRVSLFEEQQKTYKHLQSVLLQQGQLEWALGVSTQAKARALSSRLGADKGTLIGSTQQKEISDERWDVSYESVCEAWWVQVQNLARAEGSATRVVEFSFLYDEQGDTVRLAVWVLSAGELLCSHQIQVKDLETGIGIPGCRVSDALELLRVGMRSHGRDGKREDVLQSAFAQIVSSFADNIGDDVQNLVADMLPALTTAITKLSTIDDSDMQDVQDKASSWLPAAIVEWKEMQEWLDVHGLLQSAASADEQQILAVEEKIQESPILSLEETQKKKNLDRIWYQRVIEDPTSLQSVRDFLQMKLDDLDSDKIETKSGATKTEGFSISDKGAVIFFTEDAQEALTLLKAGCCWNDLRKHVPGLKGNKSVSDEKMLYEWLLAFVEEKKLVMAWLSAQAEHVREDPNAVAGLTEAFELLVLSMQRWDDLALLTLPTLDHEKLKQLGIAKHTVRCRLCERIRKLFSYTHILGCLYTLLVEPIASSLQGADEILIIPHQDLLAVPWAALLDTNDTYLIQHFAIRVAPSLGVAHAGAKSVSLASGKSTSQTLKAVVVGNPVPNSFGPLPGAKSEALSVVKVLCNGECVPTLDDIGMRVANGECDLSIVRAKSQHNGTGLDIRLLLERGAHKSTVLKALEASGLVHLACHGDLWTDSLLLAPEQDSSTGELSMDEVQNKLTLAPGATVVLSACNSGLGKIMGEGVVGLTRAFLFAGAGAVVSSLWIVDDESTALLMSAFYKYFMTGHRSPQAMRLAMLQLIRDQNSESSLVSQEQSYPTEWKQPRYWAAFVVSGASTSICGNSDAGL